jgi:hypothetical protein
MFILRGGRVETRPLGARGTSAAKATADGQYASPNCTPWTRMRVNLREGTRALIGSGPAAAGSRLGLRQARPNRSREAIGSPRLNAQSPSQRSDGDCVLRSGTPVTLIR